MSSAANRRIVLWGASGQAKVLRECLEPQGCALVAVFDNDPAAASPFADVPLFVGRPGFERWRAENPGAFEFLVAIGGDRGRDRCELQRWLGDAGLRAATAVHRTAFVARNARIGAGSQVLANATVCVEASLGEACIVNTAASVDHECELGDGVHVAPGARLAGLVRVGRHAMIGVGASVVPRVRIGAGAIVGAGAVVTRHVPDNVVVAGVPARVIKERTGS